MINQNRYEVTAPMPLFTHLLPMDILVPKVHPFSPNVPFWGKEEDADPLLWVSFCPDYPHLFRLLKWWEGLAIDELPKYIKSEMTKVVAKVEYELREDGIYGKNVLLDKWHDIKGYSDGTITATEAEYTDYLTKLNAK